MVTSVLIFLLFSTEHFLLIRCLIFITEGCVSLHVTASNNALVDCLLICFSVTAEKAFKHGEDCFLSGLLARFSFAVVDLR